MRPTDTQVSYVRYDSGQILVQDTWEPSLVLTPFQIASIFPKETGQLDNQSHDLSGKGHGRQSLAYRVNSLAFLSFSLCSALKCCKSNEMRLM